MNEITVTLSFSNTHTIYKKKVKIFKKFQNFKIITKFQKISKISRILCNKTITTLELDQYEVLWSRVQQFALFNIVVLCSIKPHIDLVQVQ